MKKKIIKAAVCFIAASMLLSGCSLLPKEEDYKTSPVVVSNTEVTYKTTTVMSGDLLNTEDVSCTYQPVKSESYTFDVAGVKFDSVYVKVGDYVTKGQLLAQLDISSIEDQLEKNENSIKSSSLQLSQLKAMRELKTNQQSDLIAAAPPEKAALLGSAQTIYNSFSSQINSISDNLTVLGIKDKELEASKSSRQLYAGISGNVTAALVKTNRDSSVQGEKVVTITDTSTSMFVASTKNYALFIPGDVYDMTVEDSTYSVKVVDPADYGIEYETPESGREGKVYFEMTDAVSSEAQSGCGQITLVLSKAENTLYVESAAVIDTPNGKMVYCFDENNIMTMKPVEIGLVTDKYTEIKSGVTANEELILE